MHKGGQLVAAATMGLRGGMIARVAFFVLAALFDRPDGRARYSIIIHAIRMVKRDWCGSTTTSTGRIKRNRIYEGVGTGCAVMASPPQTRTLPGQRRRLVPFRFCSAPRAPQRSNVEGGRFISFFSIKKEGVCGFAGSGLPQKTPLCGCGMISESARSR